MATERVSVGEVTEVKYVWTFGNYQAHTWFGEKYGTHTDWFIKEGFTLRHLDLDEPLPQGVVIEHHQKIKEVTEAEWSV